jgi:hypothetical protein
MPERRCSGFIHRILAMTAPAPHFAEIDAKPFPGSKPFQIGAILPHTKGSELRCILKDPFGVVLWEGVTTQTQLKRFGQAKQTKTPYYGK